jgi:hypothetical protein
LERVPPFGLFDRRFINTVCNGGNKGGVEVHVQILNCTQGEEDIIFKPFLAREMGCFGSRKRFQSELNPLFQKA